MAQNKILLDSNCYLRLSSHLLPLTGVSFGDEENCIYIVDELYRGVRTRHSMRTVEPPTGDHSSECSIQISQKEKSGIDDILLKLETGADENHLIIAQLDLVSLAHALVLDLPLVTNQEQLITLANNFDAEIWSMDSLLQIMRDNSFPNLDESMKEWNL